MIGKNVLERDDINATAALECPGCHRRYRRADFKSDRLTCPACGREVVALATVEEVDKEKIIRKYFASSWGRSEVLGCTGGFIVGVCFCLFVGSSLGLWALIALFSFSIWVGSKENKIKRHILVLFENVDFDIEKGLAAQRKFLKTLTEKELMSLDDKFGKDLERHLRARLAAGVTVKTTYQIPGHDEAKQVFPIHQKHEVEVYQREFDLPPEDCPFCHAPYRVADFSGKSVVCRHCGGRVRIQNAVDEAEIRKLTRDCLSELTKSETYDRKLWRSCLVSGIVMVVVCLYFSDTLISFLCSWAVWFVYLVVGVIFIGRMNRKSYRECMRLLDKEDFSLFDFEYAMKKDADSDENRLIFDRFKGKLMDLYRSDSGVVKGKVLS